MNASSGRPVESKQPNWLIPVGFLTYFLAFFLVASHASGFGPSWALVAATGMGAGMPTVMALGIIWSVFIFRNVISNRHSITVSYFGITLWLAVLLLCLAGVALAIWH